MKKLFLFSIGTEKIIEYIIVFMVWNKTLWVYRRNKMILLLYMEMKNVLMDDMLINNIESIWICFIGLQFNCFVYNSIPKMSASHRTEELLLCKDYLDVNKWKDYIYWMSLK